MTQIEITRRIAKMKETLEEEHPGAVFTLKEVAELYEMAHEKFNVEPFTGANYFCPYTNKVCDKLKLCWTCELWAKHSGFARSY